MDNETLEILVVEDNSKHMKDVQEFLEQKQEAGISVNATYVSSLEDAHDHIFYEKNKVDCIISDVFFPVTEKDGWLARRLDSGERKKLLGILEGFMYLNDPLHKQLYNDWKEGNELCPAGVLMVEYAQEKHIPIVLCTAGYHHSDKLEPVYSYNGARTSRASRSNIWDKILMVDNYQPSDMNAEADSKDWKRAFDLAVSLYEIKQLISSNEELQQLYGKDRRNPEVRQQFDRKLFDELEPLKEITMQKYSVSSKSIADAAHSL